MKKQLFLSWIVIVAGSSRVEATTRSQFSHTQTIHISYDSTEDTNDSAEPRRLQTRNFNDVRSNIKATNHLRHVKPSNDYDSGAAMLSHTYYSGKGKGAKKDGYHYDDDDYYEHEAHHDTDYEYDDYYDFDRGEEQNSTDADIKHDDFFGAEDNHFGEDEIVGGNHGYGKGYDYLSKASKGSKGGGRGSKKGAHDKKSKKSKSSKKKIDKKLKAPGTDTYDDDDWMNGDQYDDSIYEDDYWNTDDFWATAAPSPATTSLTPETRVKQSTKQATSTGRAHPRVGFVGSSTTQSPTLSPSSTAELFSSRMDFQGNHDSVITTEATSENELFQTESGTMVTQVEEASTQTELPMLSAPRVERELFPQPVQLKAHSSIHLQQHDPEFFAETTNLLTPCLKRAYTDHLQAYKLTVEYSDGPDASYAGVIITHMNIRVIISVVTDTIDALKLLTHDSASKVVHECFDGPLMYQYLGALRRQGVEINEIEFQDRPFRSPLFGNTEPSKVVSNGGNSSSMEEPKESRSGLIATFVVGLVVVGAVLFAHRRGKIPTIQFPSDRLGRFHSTMRAKFGNKKMGQLSQSIREKLVMSFSSSDESSRTSGDEMGSGSNQTSTRVRTWSGSFRRHPPGGVKPAALQKKPAFSKDFLKSPRSDDHSLSVGDDYNVPDEYDFQATPMSEMYGGRNIKAAKEPISPGDEFSMPDDYNTVVEDVSTYSKNTSILSGVQTGQPRHLQLNSLGQVASVRGQTRKHIPFVSPTRSTPSSAEDLLSPKDHAYLDEWSMNSFTTSSPHATSSADVTPPYRHWNDKPKGSPGSKLAMPKLS